MQPYLSPALSEAAPVLLQEICAPQAEVSLIKLEIRPRSPCAELATDIPARPSRFPFSRSQIAEYGRSALSTAFSLPGSVVARGVGTEEEGFIILGLACDVATAMLLAKLAQDQTAINKDGGCLA